MPHGIWLILGGLLLIAAAVLLTTGLMDQILYLVAAFLIFIGVVYLIRGGRASL